MLKLKNILIAYYGIITILTFLILLIRGSLFDVIHNFSYSRLTHSLVNREISYFISPYTAGKNVTVPLFLLYNCALFVFALLLYFRLQNYYAKIGAVHLVFAAIIGEILLLYPMDDPSRPQTHEGLLHILVSTVVSMFILTAIIFFGFAFRHMSNMSWLARYSYAISIVLFVTSVITGIVSYLHYSYLVGIVERLPIAAFLFWIFLIVIGILHSDRRIKY